MPVDIPTSSGEPLATDNVVKHLEAQATTDGSQLKSGKRTGTTLRLQKKDDPSADKDKAGERVFSVGTFKPASNFTPALPASVGGWRERVMFFLRPFAGGCTVVTACARKAMSKAKGDSHNKVAAEDQYKVGDLVCFKKNPAQVCLLYNSLYYIDFRYEKKKRSYESRLVICYVNRYSYGSEAECHTGLVDALVGLFICISTYLYMH